MWVIGPAQASCVLWVLSHVAVWMEGRHVEKKETLKQAPGKMIGFLAFVI